MRQEFQEELKNLIVENEALKRGANDAFHTPPEKSSGDDLGGKGEKGGESKKKLKSIEDASVNNSFIPTLPVELPGTPNGHFFVGDRLDCPLYSLSLTMLMVIWSGRSASAKGGVLEGKRKSQQKAKKITGSSDSGLKVRIVSRDATIKSHGPMGI